MKENNSNNKSLAIVGILIILVGGLLASLFIYGHPFSGESKKNNNSNSNNNNSGNNEKKTTDLINIDTVLSNIDASGFIYTLKKCDCTNVLSEEDYDKAVCSTYNITKEDAKAIVTKLKSNTKAQRMDTSIVCSNYEFDISNSEDDSIIFGFVGQDNKSILVSYEETGYAYDFNEDLTPFFDTYAK